MGGRLQLVITASAPISAEVLTFVRCALGCVVLEGYGQTECGAAATLTIEGDAVAGHVGIPLPCCAIKLMDVPELGYVNAGSSTGVGEICIRGPSVFVGYYNAPELTAETLDAEGWLHTGDIGHWTECGTLAIVDRRKHIFKLAQVPIIGLRQVHLAYFILFFRNILSNELNIDNRIVISLSAKH